MPSKDDRTDAERAFGAGIALATREDGGVAWDARVDSAGDLGSVSGIDELAKDLAFAAASRLSLSRGQPLTTNTLADVEAEVTDLAQRDVRVTEVRSASAQRADEGSRLAPDTDAYYAHPHDRVEVAMSVTVDVDRQYDLVFGIAAD
jgi:hypothetical protein